MEMRPIKNLNYFYMHNFDLKRPTIAAFYPSSLSSEPILKENLEHIGEYVYKYIEYMNKRCLLEEERDQAVFDVNKWSYSAKIKCYTDLMSDLSKDMNKNIAPYYWRIIKGIDELIMDKWVKADYGLFLEKKNYDPYKVVASW